MATKEPKLLKPAEFARKMGVSAQSIDNLIKQGIIPLHSGKVDIEEAKKSINDNSDPARAEFRKGGKQDITYQKARQLKEMYRAKLNQIEVQVKEGALVNAEDEIRELANLFVVIKTRIRNIAPKCAQRIAELKIQGKKHFEILAEVQGILKKEHDEALEELANWKK